MGICLPRRHDPALNDPASNAGQGADCTDAALDSLAWYEGNSQGSTHDVGGKQPNTWGLYDMHGNVCQWCLNWYGPYRGDATDPAGTPIRTGGRVLRGGYWSMYALGCRSAARSWDYPPENGPDTHRYNVCGFRLALPAGN